MGDYSNDILGTEEREAVGLEGEEEDEERDVWERG